MRDPSSRLMKFRLILEEYDFTIEYINGKENVGADALSRINITSNYLKGMHEQVMAVLTRKTKKGMQEDRESDVENE